MLCAGNSFRVGTARQSPGAAGGSGPGGRILPTRGRRTSRNIGLLRTCGTDWGLGCLLSPLYVPRGTLRGESGQMLRRVRCPIGPALSRRRVRLPRGLSPYRVVRTNYGVDRVVYASNRLSMRPTQSGHADVQLVSGAPPVTLSTTVMSASARNGEARESASHVLACTKAEILQVRQKSVWLRAGGTPSVSVPRGTPKPAACTADRHVASSPTPRPMEAGSPPVIAAAARRPKADTVDVTWLIAATP